jgi:cation diffusion facilitator CzcD-associated flavoprotein CzcO
MTEKLTRRPRVLIVGAGFGGLAAAKRLAGQPVDVTINRSGDILLWNSLSRLWCDIRIIHSRESELLLSAVVPMLTSHTS